MSGRIRGDTAAAFRLFLRVSEQVVLLLEAPASMIVIELHHFVIIAHMLLCITIARTTGVLL